MTAPDGGQGARAVGPVTNAAVALRRHAPRGVTLVDAATVAATAHALEYEPIAARGVAWHAAVRSVPRSRVAPARPATRLVGREREVTLLQELRAGVLAERRPRLVTIVGEAGIGKTRLLDEMAFR